MNIYTATSSITKVYNYMEETSDFDGAGTRGLYKCTKQRLQKLYDMCKFIMNKIAPILDSEEIEVPQEVIEAEMTNTATIISEKGTSVVADKPGNPMPDSPVVENPEKVTVKDTLSNRNILKHYDMAFAFPVENFGEGTPEEVTEIYTLVKTWYKTRFHTAMGRNCPFRYNMTQIPIWIDHIILTAADAYKNNTFEQYKKSFNEWIENLKETHHRYAVPTSVFFSMKKYSHEKVLYTCPNAYLVYQIIYGKVFDNFLDNFGDRSVTDPDKFCYSYIDKQEVSKMCSIHSKTHNIYRTLHLLRKDYKDGESRFFNDN